MTANADLGARCVCGHAGHEHVADACMFCRCDENQVAPDPVQVIDMWQATCDNCGWHTQPATPKSAVREWARLHRVTCPLKAPPTDGSPA